jgi:hypothetical protein
MSQFTYKHCHAVAALVGIGHAWPCCRAAIYAAMKW